MKNQRLFMRVTQEEKDEIEQFAKARHLTTSSYLRYLIYNDKKDDITIDVAPLQQTVHELRKQGTNLNQLMYFLNAHSSTCTQADLDNIRDTLRQESKVLEETVRTVYGLQQEAQNYKLLLKSSAQEQEVDGK